jgi:hypothetical protein
MDTTSISIRTTGNTDTLCYRIDRGHSQPPTHTATCMGVATLTIMVTATRMGSRMAR